MIKGLMGGPGVVIQGGDTSVPYINQNIQNPMQGMLRVWGSEMQVFDGSSWITMSSSYATVELTGETHVLLQWARDQRDKQFKREHLLKGNPALQKALEAIQRAEANFDLLEKFVENDHDQPTSSP
jgi:hypothetical protein